MNNKVVLNSLRFVVLVLLQVLLFSKINFLGYINPYPYILFILLLPIKMKHWQVLFYSFLIGLTIDLFQDSGGINAAASVFIAFIRPATLKFSFGVSYEHQTIKFEKTPWSQRFTYILILVLAHHFLLFLLEVFNLSYIILILKKTLFSSIFTILLIVIITSLFEKRR